MAPPSADAPSASSGKAGTSNLQPQTFSAQSRPDVAVLVVIFTVDAGQLQVLLIRRSAEPFKDFWSLPGGLLAAGGWLDDPPPPPGPPAWSPVSELPPLAFQNEAVIGYALHRLRAKLDYSNVAYSLLPADFTLSQLQRTYEAILSRPLDKRNFRKRILSLP